ncbi:MAG: threonine--tRNA ligase, partial [Lentisphaerota bacterium]
SIAGSYYRGKESNPMLQRIYGTAFNDKKELHDYLKLIEEAKKRDHRKLGKELDLFSISEQVGGGLVLWHPKGSFVRNVFETYWREEHYKNGYDLLYTPHIGKSQLWETSGHLSFYKDAMYAPMDIDGNDYYVKPMNCPFHIEIYQSKLRSYKELPLRWAELGTVYRYEKSGVLHGLLRVRGFTQDDAHIICTPEQIESEILNVLKFSLDIWKAFGFTDIKAYLATRPEKAVGEPEKWKKALVSLEKAVRTLGLECEVDEGGGAFYGPKIDLKIKDAIGREWQMSTIQFDFNLPERFGMTYIGDDGLKHQPFMVHRALLGSIERFFGILVEHYSGAFPMWLAPEQVRILPITDNHHPYAKELAQELKCMNFRVEVDSRSETIGAKIKNARNERVPYIAVVGDKEIAERSLSVRSRREGELGSIAFDKLKEKLIRDVALKV